MIIILSIILLGLILLYRNKKLIFLLFFFSLLTGYFTGIIHINRESNLSFLENQKVLIQGQVIQPPLIKEDKIEVYIRTDKIVKDGKDYLIEEKVLGNIYFYDESKSNISISEGNIIRFQGRIKLPKEKRNPGGFDYSTYLKTKNVYSTLSIGEESVEVLGKNH